MTTVLCRIAEPLTEEETKQKFTNWQSIMSRGRSIKRFHSHKKIPNFPYKDLTQDESVNYLMGLIPKLYPQHLTKYQTIYCQIFGGRGICSKKLVLTYKPSSTNS